jgi:hypothetical protein
MTYQLSLDVPEVSARETETALRVEATAKSETDAKGNVVAAGRYGLDVDIRSYGGSLYRYVGRPGAWLHAFAGKVCPKWPILLSFKDTRRVKCRTRR